MTRLYFKPLAGRRKPKRVLFALPYIILNPSDEANRGTNPQMITIVWSMITSLTAMEVSWEIKSLKALEKLLSWKDI